MTTPQPTLVTARLRLRPFHPDDAADVRRLAGAPEVADTTLNIPHPYEEGMAEAWIATHQPEYEAGRLATFAITLADGTLVGAIGLRIRREHERAELGYWVGVPYWNRGYATEAARAMVTFAFSGLGLHRVNAHHMTRNPGSGRVMQKVGMRHEGTLRQHVRKGGRFEDIEMYAVLRSEWQA
jgi:RimJ/RimL family protein N-acetyltransferase